MKLKSLLMSLLAILYCSVSFSQFTPNQNENYFDQRGYWKNYYDSIKEAQIVQGTTDERIPGYSAYLRWQKYWDLYMPSSGSYEEALEKIMNLTKLFINLMPKLGEVLRKNY